MDENNKLEVSCCLSIKNANWAIYGVGSSLETRNRTRIVHGRLKLILLISFSCNYDWDFNFPISYISLFNFSLILYTYIHYNIHLKQNINCF